jgi:hypothetical protein
MDLVETGWGGVDWIGVAQDMGKWRALVNAAKNLRMISRLVLIFMALIS